jgi:serine/threonine protein kinase
MLNSECWVESSDGRVGARMLKDRARHIIYRLDDGRIAKIVKPFRDNRGRQEALLVRRRIVRNRMIWRFLNNQDHPGLLRVFERVVDSSGGEGFVCEHLENDGPMENRLHPILTSVRSFLTASIQLCEAVQLVHDRGWVHADLTFNNIRFRSSLQPVIFDLELSVRAGQFPNPFPERQRDTRTALTPTCCAPEQMLRGALSPATDVYTLGLTLASWITGQQGVSTHDLRQSMKEICDLSRRGIYPHWEMLRERIRCCDVIQVLETALKFNPGDRYKNGEAFAQALRHLLHTLPSAVLDASMHEDPTIEITPLPLCRTSECSLQL